ncbi:hypothetical protein NL676_003179 [Syzygium grande]|nr:hypothetical protein NL676_003179 [Syzygium grande]
MPSDRAKEEFKIVFSFSVVSIDRTKAVSVCVTLDGRRQNREVVRLWDSTVLGVSTRAENVCFSAFAALHEKLWETQTWIVLRGVFGSVLFKDTISKDESDNHLARHARPKFSGLTETLNGSSFNPNDGLWFAIAEASPSPTNGAI